MDPDATYRDMITYNQHGDTDFAQELARQLSDWMQRGGFPPKYFDVLTFTICLQGRLL